MNTGEDEPSSGLNGRLRPRKSNATLPSPAGRSSRKTDNKFIQDKQRRNVTPSKTAQNKTDDLVTPQPPPVSHLLCPYCERKFATKLSASKHARRIHLSTLKQDQFINCLYCNHAEAESHDIIRHMVDSHPNQYFACLDCHTRFPSTTELAEHKLNVCEKQKAPYRSKLRQKNSVDSKKNKKRLTADQKGNFSNENKGYTNDNAFSGLVISCELKPSQGHDAVDIEDNITTNLILPPGKTLTNANLDKNTVMVLDDLQWNKRISTPNFTFHNTDADQILSRLGVVHRSPRVGESTRRAWLKMLDENNQKFEKCFDTNFYSKVASNVQENLSRFLDGSFNFNPDADSSIKTRKSKSSVVINTAEGFPILLAFEQFSRHVLDGYMPRPVAPKHKWKWGSNENEENALVDPNAIKRDSHVNNCIITLVSSLDIWTQLRMRRKFEDVFSTTSSEKTEKNNIISLELKEILESRELPTPSSQVVKYTGAATVPPREKRELPSYLGLSPVQPKCEEQPAVLSGEWVRPRCYICCACGEQTRDSKGLTSHMSTQHPYAQVQHYEIVGDTLLNSDIIKHLYVPPSQVSNRTRPPRGFRDCTKCKKSIAMEDMHQHMLDCAGDTPAVRRKVRYRPFGVRRRRTRLSDNTIRKKIRKEIRSRHRQKVHMRPRPKIRTEVGDAETIRKMIADLPAKRARVVINNTITNIRTKKNIDNKKRGNLKINRHNTDGPKHRITRSKKSYAEVKDNDNQKKQLDNTQSDDDDEPLKLNTKSLSDKTAQYKETESTKTSSTQRSKRSLRNHKINPETNKTRFLNKSNISGSSTRRVNVKSSGVRVKQRGTRNERNEKRQTKSGGDSDSAGASKDSGDINNTTSGANVDLKHSIARLTADKDTEEKATQEIRVDTEPKQDVIEHAPTDKQQLFENDTKTDKLDKPPISQNIAKTSDNGGVQKTKSNKPRKRLTDCIAMLAKKVSDPGQELKEASELIKGTSDTDKTQSKSDSNDGHQMDKRDETLAKYHDSLRGRLNVANVPSHETTLQQPDAGQRHLNTAHIERSNLQLSFAPDNSGASNDPDPPVIVSRHMSGSSMVGNVNVTITPDKTIPRTLTATELLDSRYQRKSAEEPIAETIPQRRSSYYDPNFVQPQAKQIDAGRRKSSQQLAMRAENESRAQQIYNPTNLSNFAFYPRPEYCADANSSNARRKSYDCTPTAAAFNHYYHSHRPNFLSVPMFARPPHEGIDKNFALQLFNYSRNPADMTSYTEGIPSELGHLVNWEGHPRHLYTSPSPDSRHIRRDSLQRDTVPSSDINLETPQNYNLISRTTPAKTPDRRVCVTPVKHDPHRPSPDLSTTQQVNNNYMRCLTTPEILSMNPPLSVGVRRETYKRVFDTADKEFHSQELSDDSQSKLLRKSPDNLYSGGVEFTTVPYNSREKVSVCVSPLSHDSVDYKKLNSETFYSHVSGKSNDSFNTSVSETSISETQRRGNEAGYSVSRDFEHDVRQGNIYDERPKPSKEQYSDTTPVAHHSNRLRSPLPTNLSRSQQEVLNMRIPKETMLYPEGTSEQLLKNQTILNVTQHHYDIPTAHRTSVADVSKHTLSIDHSDIRVLDNYKNEMPLNMTQIYSELDRPLSNETEQMPLDLSAKGPEDKNDIQEQDDGPKDMSKKTCDQQIVELRVKSLAQLSNPEYETRTPSNFVLNQTTFMDSNYNQAMTTQQSSKIVDNLEHRENVEKLFDLDQSKCSQYTEREHINKTISHEDISKGIPKITVNHWEREELEQQVTISSGVENLRPQLTDIGMEPEKHSFPGSNPHKTNSNRIHIALQTDNDQSFELSQSQKDVGPSTITNVHHDSNVPNMDIGDKRKNLPKEIIDLIGDLPKGNLDRLLDILPQYVCIPNTERKDNNQFTPEEDSNINTPIVTTAVDVTVTTNDKTLTVNTNLLSAPSCIIPKKRHSPKLSYAQQYHQKYLEANNSSLTSSVNAVMSSESLIMHDVKPNINDPCIGVMPKIISTEDPQFKVIDLTDDKTSTTSKAMISVDNSATLPIGQDLFKSTKPKNSSDKTASLRAVRFKKSSSDALQLPTSLEGVQNVNQGLLTLDKSSLETNSLPATDETKKVVSGLQNEKDIAIEKQLVPDATEARYEVVPQQNNKEPNHFLGSSLKEGLTESKVTSSDICVTSVPSSDIRKEKESLVEPSSELLQNVSTESRCVDKNPQNKPLTVNCDFARSTSKVITEHVSPDSVLEPKTNNKKSNDKNERNPDLADSLIEIQKPDSSNEVLSDTKNLEEYDSDDDVSLAFIVRQKQLDRSNLKSTDSIRSKTEAKTKISGKQCKKQKKTKTKRTKSLTTKKMVSDHEDEKNSKSMINDCTEVEKGKGVVEDSNLSNEENDDIPIKRIEPPYEYDVNKENDSHDHLHTVKDSDKVENSDQRALNEKNIVEDKVEDDNETNKTLKELKEIRDTKEQKEIEDSTSKNIGQKRKKGKEVTNNNKIHDTETLTKDDSKIITVEVTEEPKIRATEGSNDIQEQNAIQSDIELITGKTVKKCTKQKKKISINDDGIPLPGVSVTPTPLRRSRRGKSFYADTNISVDIEPISQTVEKLPLTKKQLIFSKLLQDENETIDSVSENGNEISNKKIISVTNSDIKKSKAMKRKKSPLGKRKSKKNKSFESQTDEEFSDNNVTLSSVAIEENLNDIAVKDNSLTNVQRDTATDVDNSIPNIQLPDNISITENKSIEQPILTEKRKSDSTDIISTLPKKSKVYEGPDEVSADENNENGYESENIEANNDDDQVQEYIEETIEKTNSDFSDSPINKQDDNILKTQHKDNTNSIYRKRNDSGCISETRTACYNRQIEYRQSRSSVILDRNSEHYDPYDIDLDDMIEIAQPIIKNNKGKHSKNSPKRSKRGKRKASVHIDYNSSSSDSDSSKSDVPLQKYFEEKRLLEHRQYKGNKENMITIRKVSHELQPVVNLEKVHKLDHIDEKVKNADICELTNIPVKDDEPDTTVSSEIDHKNKDDSRSVEIDSEARNSKSIDETLKSVERDIGLDEDQEQNDMHNITIPSTVEKQVKEKRRSKSINTQNVNTDNLANESSTDKFLENFGFFSERKPRKSNLLAAKKIAETIHMINDSDDAYFSNKDRTNRKLTHHREGKKSTDGETTIRALQGSVKMSEDLPQCTIPQEEIKKIETKDQKDKDIQSDTEMDPIMAQSIFDSEEVRNLENDLIDGFRKAAEENANLSIQKDCSSIENNSQNEMIRDLTSPEDNDLEPTSTETKKSKNKPPKIRPPGYKEMMYPEINIEDIDLFEDKFDKIKRKCRSQAAAAKQTSVAESTSPCDKSRKKPEKKIKKKCGKKNIQSTNVPTKAALKGFDGIKISIPTQDLNMPPSISPPRLQKKRSNNKKKRDRKESDSSSKYDSDHNNSMRTQEKDIYEFKDNDDTELLELRPSTVMDRFRSLNKEQSKQKCKDKDSRKSSRHADSSDDHDPDEKVDNSIDNKYRSFSEVDNEQKNKVERRKTANSKFDALSFEVQSNVDDNKYLSGNYKLDPDFGNAPGPSRKMKSAKGNEDETIEIDNFVKRGEENTKPLVDNFDDDSFDGVDNIPLASTARFVPPTNDDSSFDWSPELPYVDTDLCTCKSPSSDSETRKKACDSTKCVYLKNNAKKAVMGKIFKNNAVRENNEPSEPAKDLDQLFDSLLESNSNDASFKHSDSGKNNKDIYPVTGASKYCYNDNTSPRVLPHDRTTSLPFSQESLQSRVVNEGNTSQEEMDFDSFSRLLNTPSTSAGAAAFAPYEIVQDDEDSVSNNDDFFDEFLSRKEVESNDVIPIDGYVMMCSRNTQTEDPKTIVATKLKPRCDDDELDLDETETNDAIILRRKAITDCNGTQTEISYNYSVFPGENEENFREDDDDDIGNTPLPGDYTMMSTKFTQTNAKKHKSRSKHNDDQRSEDDVFLPIDTLPMDKITLKRFVATSVKSTQTEHHKNKSRKSSKHDESNFTKFAEPSTSKDKRSKAKQLKKIHKAEIKDHNGVESGEESLARDDKDHETVLSLDDLFMRKRSPSTKSEEGTIHNEGDTHGLYEEDTGVARQRARRKCTVGKQNVLAEHWSSESEVEAVPARPSSADSVVGARRKKSKKREGQQASGSGKRVRQPRKEGEENGRAPPPGPTNRPRPALLPPYWSSDTEDTTTGAQPQHGWIVGDSHKKLVTLLANAKGRKRTNDDKRNLDE